MADAVLPECGCDPKVSNQPCNPNEHAKLRSELASSLGTKPAKSSCYSSSHIGSEGKFIAALLYKHHGLGSAIQGAKWPSEELDDGNALVRRRAYRQCVADVPSTVLILHNFVTL